MRDNFDELQENKQHGSFFFHLSVYENSEFFPDMAPHWHDEFEILCGMQGSPEVHIGEDVFVLEKDQIIFVPSDTIHYSNSKHEPFYFEAIVFDPYMLCSSPEDVCMQNYIEPIKKHNIDYSLHIAGVNDWEKSIIAYTKKIIEYFAQKPLGYELAIKGFLCSLFFELVSNNRDKHLVDDKKFLEIERLKNIFLYIQKNYIRKITIEELAAQSYMSVYYFCRFFKKVIGISPLDYLNHYRIREAARLLKTNEKSITDIAYAVGFNDSSYFSKIFQKYQRCTPSEYRAARSS